ncbi:hypothetical protein CDAR_435001 [Caerostris darwini]|uniref:Uncharacterized protein n=1 Tax=Caerostris darwini TaxID=1538125 RepID=A0AAV4QGB6_9ARAC|nr:hypothetical protein CDAR_435001 [Caerostris darwini]
MPSVINIGSVKLDVIIVERSGCVFSAERHKIHNSFEASGGVIAGVEEAARHEILSSRLAPGSGSAFSGLYLLIRRCTKCVLHLVSYRHPLGGLNLRRRKTIVSPSCY